MGSSLGIVDLNRIARYQRRIRTGEVLSADEVRDFRALCRAWKDIYNRLHDTVKAHRCNEWWRELLWRQKKNAQAAREERQDEGPSLR